jgi:peptide/nickel transport system permease protein
MTTYILRRILLVFPLLLGISIINYTILALAPGDPVSAMIDPFELSNMTAEDLQEAREALGLNKPIPVRYLLWLGQALQGNLGYSIWFNTPVFEVMLRALGNSMPVMIFALLVSTVAGIILGIVSALKPYSLLDSVLTTFAFAGVAVPGFFFALLLIYAVAIKMDILPTGGVTTPGVEPSFGDRFAHIILPGLALAYETTGSLLRYTRASLLEVLNQDYMTTARAKGLVEHIVILRHGLRNALLPIITVLGLRLPSMFGGAVLIETVFNYPGVGLTIFRATEIRDYPLMMGGVLMTAILVLLSNLLADLVYTMADPRIRYEEG